jgi:hypothetical protein
LCSDLDGLPGGLAGPATQMEVGLDRRCRQEFEQGSDGLAQRDQVSSGILTPLSCSIFLKNLTTVLHLHLDSPEALSDYAFRRVILHGHFAQPIMLVGPRVYEGAGGYHLIQPFIRTPVDSNTSGSAPTLKNKKKKESSFSFWRKDDEAEEAAALLSESNKLDARSTDGSVDDGSMTPILVNRGFISTARAQEYRLNPSPFSPPRSKPLQRRYPPSPTRPRVFTSKPSCVRLRRSRLGLNRLSHRTTTRRTTSGFTSIWKR